MSKFPVFCQDRGGEALKGGGAKGVSQDVSKSLSLNPSHSKLPPHRPPLQVPGTLIAEPSEDAEPPLVSVGFPIAQLVLGFLGEAELRTKTPSAFPLLSTTIFFLSF